MSEEEKAELEELYENSEWWHNRFNAVQRDYENLQQKIDKAIEYLKTFHFIDNIRVLDIKECEKLLKILGEKENESR